VTDPNDRTNETTLHNKIYGGSKMMMTKELRIGHIKIIGGYAHEGLK